MKKTISILAVFLFFFDLAMGQHQGTSLFFANWQSGFPVGNSFLSNYSARGFNFGYNRFVSDDLSVGIDFGWSNYYQYQPKKTYEFPDGAATTDLYKYIYTAPMTITVTKYFSGGNVATPYVKLGLGAQYSEQNLYYNVYETTNDNWGFVAIPEIGTLIHFGKYKPTSINVGVRYQFSTNSKKEFGITNLQTVSFLLGLALSSK
jgi:hypothetical protein